MTYEAATEPAKENVFRVPSQTDRARVVLEAMWRKIKSVFVSGDQSSHNLETKPIHLHDLAPTQKEALIEWFRIINSRPYNENTGTDHGELSQENGFQVGDFVTTKAKLNLFNPECDLRDLILRVVNVAPDGSSLTLTGLRNPDVKFHIYKKSNFMSYLTLKKLNPTDIDLLRDCGIKF